MIKLWYYRMHDNARPSWAHVPSDDDDAPRAFHTDAGLSGGQEPIWARMWHWMLGNGRTHGDAPRRPCTDAELGQLSEQLNTAAGGSGAARIEPRRVGAAYRLALAGSAQAAAVLESAFVRGAANATSLGLSVDGVERSAAYGLAALPAGAGVPALVRAAAAAAAQRGGGQPRWRNKRALALHALGQCASTHDAQVLQLLRQALGDDSSVFVQSTAALALGYLGRRAGAEGNAPAVHAIVSMLLPPLHIRLGALLSNGVLEGVDIAEGIGGPEDPASADASHPSATEELVAGVTSMPRSATRELAVTALLMTASACASRGVAATLDPPAWEGAVEALSALSHVDPNRFVLGA